MKSLRFAGTVAVAAILLTSTAVQAQAPSAAGGHAEPKYRADVPKS